MKIRIQAVASLALLCVPAVALASDESDVLRARAVRSIQAGDCDAALPLLQRALDTDPHEARAGLLKGQCLISQHRYADAETALLDAEARDPRLPGVQLQLAVARYHRDDMAGARSALEAARPESSGDAQFELYDGMVLSAEGRRTESLEAFARARAADAERVDPVASYYEGLAAGGARQEQRARSSLERVAAQDPGGPWGNQARQQLDRMGRGLQADGWVAATLGVEWDSNALLQGEGVELPSEFDSERDSRLVWQAQAGIEALRTLDWSGGAMLTYTGSAYQDVEDLNTHYPVGSLWIDRHLSERTTAHLQYDLGFAWVDHESWLTSHNLGPALYHDWGNGQQTRLFGRAFVYDFRFDRVDDTGAEEHYRNRDGNGVGVGAEHLFPVDALASKLNAGVMGTRYWARGDEYSFHAIETWLGSRTALPAKFSLMLRGGYIYRPYVHETSFRDPDNPSEPLVNGHTGTTRRDNVTLFEAALERPLTDNTSASVRWRWTDNKSNADVFDYDRSILGAYMSVRFD